VWSRTGPDRSTAAIIAGGLAVCPRGISICAVAGFWVPGIVLGPVVIVCGWLAMGRTRARGSRA